MRELSDLGERIRWSFSLTSCDTTREAPALPRRLGFFSPSGVSAAGAFSLSE